MLDWARSYLTGIFDWARIYHPVLTNGLSGGNGRPVLGSMGGGMLVFGLKEPGGLQRELANRLAPPPFLIVRHNGIKNRLM